MADIIRPNVIIRVERGKTRCHPYLADLLVIQTLLLKQVASEFAAEFEDLTATFSCRAADLEIIAPLNEFSESALTGKVPDLFEMVSRPKVAREERGIPILGIQGGMARFGCALFSLFSEYISDWTKRCHSTDYEAWPPTINFCRVVRNAIVHGGRIRMNSPNSVAVSWRTLTYSYTDLGKEVINNGDLSVGDLIVLMLEMETELYDLGAPFDLG